MNAEVLQHHHPCLIFVYPSRDDAVSPFDVASLKKLLFGQYPTLSPTLLSIPSIFVFLQVTVTTTCFVESYQQVFSSMQPRNNQRKILIKSMITIPHLKLHFETP